MRYGKAPKFKYISICFLDLLEKTTTLLRVNPDNVLLLKAMINAVDEIEKSNGEAGLNGKEGLPEWEKLLDRVFGKGNFKDVSNYIFYYPNLAQLLEDQYLMMMKMYSRFKTMDAKNKNLIYEFTDMVHNFPVVLKRSWYDFNGLFFWVGSFRHFVRKYKTFFTADEVKEVRKWCKIPWWKFWL